jgi:hypothetical protein
MTFDICIIPQIALDCLNDELLFIALEIVQVSFRTGRQGYPEGHAGHHPAVRDVEVLPHMRVLIL